MAPGSCVWRLRDDSGMFVHMAVPAAVSHMCTLACVCDLNITFCCESMTFCAALGVKSVCKYVCVIASRCTRMEVVQGVGSRRAFNLDDEHQD